MAPADAEAPEAARCRWHRLLRPRVARPHVPKAPARRPHRVKEGRTCSRTNRVSVVRAGGLREGSVRWAAPPEVLAHPRGLEQHVRAAATHPASPPAGDPALAALGCSRALLRRAVVDCHSRSRHVCSRTRCVGTTAFGKRRPATLIVLLTWVSQKDMGQAGDPGQPQETQVTTDLSQQPLIYCSRNDQKSPHHTYVTP